MPRQTSDYDVEAALRHCVSEPVHAPGYIQPHGALIAVESGTLQITFASLSTSDFLRAPCQEMLGKPLSRVFGGRIRHMLAQGMSRISGVHQTTDLGLCDLGTARVCVTAAAAGASTIFEFEPTFNRQDRKFGAHHDLEQLLREIHRAQTRQEVFEGSARILRMLSGYDRVLICSFDDENKVHIVGEDARPGDMSYIGLRFPFWDIPAKARAVMTRQPLRYIADLNAQPSPILSADPRAPELDLTHAHLRGPSSAHLEDLRRMELRATFTLHIKSQGRLWGIISLHHGSPRYPGQHIRQICRRFGEFFSLLVLKFERSDDLAQREAIEKFKRKQSKSVAARPHRHISAEPQLLAALEQKLRHILGLIRARA